MSLPYRISDRVVFTVLTTGVEILTRDPDTGAITRAWDLSAQPIMPEGDRHERAMDLLLRADPDNAYDGEDTREVAESIIYIGNADRQDFPLKPDQSLNLRVTRRNDIWFKGASSGLKLHMVAALLDVGGT